MTLQCGNATCPHCRSIRYDGVHNCDDWDVKLHQDCGFFEHNNINLDAPLDEWNDGYYIEGVDRCNTVCIMLEELLLGHPSLDKIEDGAAKYTRIQDLLGGLYQDLGRSMIAKEKS